MNSLRDVSAKAVALFVVFSASAGTLGPVGCSSSDDSGTQAAGTPQTGTGGSGGSGAANGGPVIADGNGGKDAGGFPISVGHDAQVCKEDGLLFKLPGCSCAPGTADRACWTGPPNQRNVGHCHDGTQHCSGDREFGQWTECEGEELLCDWPGEHIDAGSTDAGPPNPPGCTCIPGKMIACDEDCATLVICSLTGYKTCQPDGTWGPCRETTNLDVLGNVLGCRNWLHACALGQGEGFYTGDCSQAYTCGKAPGQL